MYENPEAAKTKLTFSFHFFGGDNFRLFSPLSPPTGSRSPVLLSLAGAKGNNSSLALSKRKEKRSELFSDTVRIGTYVRRITMQAGIPLSCSLDQRADEQQGPFPLSTSTVQLQASALMMNWPGDSVGQKEGERG